VRSQCTDKRSVNPKPEENKKMKRNVRLALGAVVLLSVMFFTVSCTKKMVKTETVPTTAQPEVSKSLDSPSAEAEPAGQLPKEQLRTEEPAPEAPAAVFVNENVRFAFDSSALSDQAREILSNKAEYLLRANSETRVTVEGHCDERGTDAYNLALGERRAEAVKHYLIVLGVTADRLNTISYGEERPADPGHNEASWAKNRRAQFVFN
jgi:peptidoglycan-associated lipoprotein